MYPSHVAHRQVNTAAGSSSPHLATTTLFTFASNLMFLLLVYLSN